MHEFKVGDIVVFEKGRFAGTLAKVIAIDVGPFKMMRVLPQDHWHLIGPFSTEELRYIALIANPCHLNFWDLE